MYPTTRECEQRGNNRCWPTQTATVAEDLDSDRSHHPVLFILTDSVSLPVGAVVWFAWLFIGLLVRLQNEDRAIRDLHHPDCVIAKRDFSSLSTTLRGVCFRKPDDHSQQSTIPVFTRKIHQTTRLGRVDRRRFNLRLKTERRLAAIRALLAPTPDDFQRSDLWQVARLLSLFAAALRFAQRVAARRYVHHTHRRRRVFVAWTATNGAEAERPLVLGRGVSRSLLRARAVSSRAELAHLSVALSVSLGRSCQLLRRDLH
jgi:hypothetical protein